MATFRLFDESSLRKLDRLALVASKVRAGQIKGERRSTKRGTSIEFADYREYTRGDDLRRLDWNVYARLERPFIKLLEEEEDLAVHILLDASKSMDWPEKASEPQDRGNTERGSAPSLNKYLYGQRLTAALGYIALATGDRLALTVLHGGDRPVQFGPVRGRGHALRLLSFLEKHAASGTTDLNASLHDYALAGSRAGLAFVISDLFSPAGYREGLTDLQGRGFEVGLLHLLSPDELDPPLAGDLRLLDVETGTAQDVTLNGGLRELYRRRVIAWRDEIEAHCRQRDIHYIPVVTDLPWDKLVLYHLRRRGIVK